MNATRALSTLIVVVSLSLLAASTLVPAAALAIPPAPLRAREDGAGAAIPRDAAPMADLAIPLTVKENADVGATAYPVSVVIPLPRGRYTTTTSLGIREAPSQVEALERWPQDGSLRHVLVHFQPSVGVHSDAIYTFSDGGALAPALPITVAEASDVITVTTGPLQFTVSKRAFNILDQVWFDQDADGAYTDAERMITSHPHAGGALTPRPGAGPTQFDADRTDVSVTIEESGPLRAVIRAEAVTHFVTTTQHIHGFATRIYAYAGQPYVKIDYQIQNSDKDVVRSWPLYFEAMGIDFGLSLTANPTATFGLHDGVYQRPAGGGLYLAQEMHNRYRIYDSASRAVLVDPGDLANSIGPAGFVDISDESRGVAAVIRNFWQMWPNGLAVDDQNHLSLQIFPPWSAQWHDGQFSPSGLYWLEDMQHVYKEALLWFHGPRPADAALNGLARTFQFPPIAVVPTDWYRQTQATLDLGGVLPTTIPTAPDERQPIYYTSGFNPEDWYNASGPFYGAGWVNFWDPEPGYRTASCTTGGWPYSAGALVATGNPSDYFTAEGWAIGEVNLRPQMLAQYTHEADGDRLRLTENPYCGGRWRTFDGGASKLAAPPLPDTDGETPVYYARDDQHGWFYHVAESYFYTANPWVRDWYRFIAEFRRVRLERLDPFPDTSSRATGHALNNALQAYRVTGDATILAGIAAHIRDYLRPEQDPYYGDQSLAVEPSGGGFQTGYLMRAIVDYLEEVRGRDAQAYAEGFNYLSGLIEWNYHYGNFPYYFDARAGGEGASDGSGLTLVDPQAWYYWHTGKGRYLDQIEEYRATGINGGGTPYGDFAQWTGQFEGRYYRFVTETSRADTTPPAAIADLTATIAGTSVTLRWTGPADVARYHVVWSTRLLAEENTLDPGMTNWWAAHVIAPALTPTPGAPQDLTFDVGSASPVYAAIFSFDGADNMSALSNVALAVAGGTPTSTATPTGTLTPQPTPTLTATLEATVTPTNGSRLYLPTILRR
jgi:hypothetical protein